MNISRTISAVLVVVALASVVPARAGAPTPAPVHPWVLEHTLDGHEAQFFVVLREQADLQPARSLESKAAKGHFVFQALRDTAESSQADLRALLEKEGVWHRPFMIVNSVLVRGDRELVERLARRPDVLRIEGNPVIHNELPSTAPGSSSEAPNAVEWGVSRTNAPAAWALGFTGQGIVVGGQDTGVDWDHPAIRDQYRGWDGEAADHDYSWHDAIHDAGDNPCGSDSPEPCDDHGHGTHTIGTVVGDDGGSNQIGMAPGARWIACRNMDAGNGTPATYIECLEFFLAPYPYSATPAEGDPSKAPDVTNNSWSCPPSEGCSWDTLQAAIDAQRAAGIMTVVSATNDGPSCATVTDPPAIYDSVYSVGSTTSSDQLSSFSSRGPAATNGDDPTLMKPDIAAPGSGIRSALPGGGYGTMSGTSMAGPHVAGAVAILWSALPELTNDQTATEAQINETAVRLTGIVEGCGGDNVDGPNNSWGHGLVDVEQALIGDTSLQPNGLEVELVDGLDNGVLERGEQFRLAPSWFNPGTFVAPSITGQASAATGLLIAKDTASYGDIPAGAEQSCSGQGDCYSVRVSSSRPAGHVDRTLNELLSSGETAEWVLHIGESFTDVATDFWAYPSVETILHHGVTLGCGGGLYCPGDIVPRWQMALFLARAMTGPAEIPLTGVVPGKGSYDCSPGGTSLFDDILPTDSACAAVHYLATHEITLGCGGSLYCPNDPVARREMAAFLARAMAGDNPIPTTGTVLGMGDYDCSPGGASVFADLTADDWACPEVHFIASYQVTLGCGGSLYCPGEIVTRAQMAAFLERAFSLELYGP